MAMGEGSGRTDEESMQHSHSLVRCHLWMMGQGTTTPQASLCLKSIPRPTKRIGPWCMGLDPESESEWKQCIQIQNRRYHTDLEVHGLVPRFVVREASTLFVPRYHPHCSLYLSPTRSTRSLARH